MPSDADAAEVIVDQSGRLCGVSNRIG